MQTGGFGAKILQRSDEESLAAVDGVRFRSRG